MKAPSADPNQGLPFSDFYRQYTSAAKHIFTINRFRGEFLRIDYLITHNCAIIMPDVF